MTARDVRWGHHLVLTRILAARAAPHYKNFTDFLVYWAQSRSALYFLHPTHQMRRVINKPYPQKPLQLPRYDPDELCLSYIRFNIASRRMDVALGAEGKHDQHVLPQVSSQSGRFVHLELFFCQVSFVELNAASRTRGRMRFCPEVTHALS